MTRRLIFRRLLSALAAVPLVGKLAADKPLYTYGRQYWGAGGPEELMGLRRSKSETAMGTARRLCEEHDRDGCATPTIRYNPEGPMFGNHLRATDEA